jgi:bifunctional DNase/RNase
MNFLEVKLEGLAMDMSTNSPVVILASESVDKVLPIWIGHAEAWAIAMELSGMHPKRPLTHDLLKRVIESLNGIVQRIEITDMRDQTFFAIIHIQMAGVDRQIDARPSDSIALALKTGASIFVNEELFTMKLSEATESDPEAPPAMPTDRESLRERLRKLNPEDFGKYSL